MDFHGENDVSEALRLVGEILAAQGLEYAVTILGGAALNLLGIVERTTSDVDILGFAVPKHGEAPNQSTVQEPPRPMPEPLVRAAETVARDLGLDPHWLNTGPALQWRVGLPPGLPQRVEWREYPGLWVGVVSRYDLIFFKLFAAADSTGTGSVHYQDLMALHPSDGELTDAAAWVATQDASPQFAGVLDVVVRQVRHNLDLG